MVSRREVRRGGRTSAHRKWVISVLWSVCVVVTVLVFGAGVAAGVLKRLCGWLDRQDRARNPTRILAGYERAARCARPLPRAVAISERTGLTPTDFQRSVT